MIGGKVDMGIFMQNDGYMKGKLNFEGRNVDHDDTKFKFGMKDGVMTAKGTSLVDALIAGVKGAGEKGIHRDKILVDLDINAKTLEGLLKKAPHVWRDSKNVLYWSTTKDHESE